MRPIIGITAAAHRCRDGISTNGEVQRHTNLLSSLDAETVVLEPAFMAVEAIERHKLTGLLFSGGGDVAASRYGGREDLNFERVDEERDAGEFVLFRYAYAKRIPMLCVCRGMQLANVALGGTLIEDLRTELGEDYRIHHNQIRELDRPPSEHTHEVRVSSNSALAKTLATTSLWTNSMHHQAIRALASSLRSVGRTDDGIIEAVELSGLEFFFFGVQWHPEYLSSSDSSLRLYEAFLGAVRATLP